MKYVQILIIQSLVWSAGITFSQQADSQVDRIKGFAFVKKSSPEKK
jgi:hypothetical protein